MKIIIGLGNPGNEYEGSRHNAGFMIIDKLNKLLNFEDFKEKTKFNALVSEGNFREEKVILVKPLTFMNLSGRTVSAIANFYKVIFTDILVAYDDLDFELGVFKLREHGSAGSHNGMDSVITSIGSETFPRLRIGIENRTELQKNKMSGKDYVLGKFTKKEEKTIKEVINKAAEALLFGLEKGIPEAMNKYNTK